MHDKNTTICTDSDNEIQRYHVATTELKVQ